MTGISLIIPTYNRAELLKGTLASLAGMRIPEGVDVELLVINNNCTDNTAEIVAEAAVSTPFPVRHLVETQQGLCYGRNRGIAEARFEHLGYLDDDILINPQWLNGVKWAIEKHQADVIVGPVSPLFEGEKPEYIRGRALSLIDSWYSRKGNEPLVLDRHNRSELPGCNFAVRKACVMAVGGFDTTLDRIGRGLIAGGDTDLGVRLCTVDAMVVYHPHCSIEHVIVSEKLSFLYLRRRAWGLGATRYHLKRRHGRARVWPSMQVFGQQLARLMWSHATGRRGIARDCELKLIEAAGYLAQWRPFHSTCK